MLTGKPLEQLGSPSPGTMGPPELVMFDPSEEPIGHGVELENLEAVGNGMLASLSDYPWSHYGNSGHEVLRSAAGQDLSQNPTGSQAEHTTPTTGIALALAQNPGKSKTSMMYHHKQRHIHKPRAPTKHPTKDPSSHDLELQPLHSPSGEDRWPDPVRYITTHEMGFHLFNLRITRSGVRCIRSIKMTLTQSSDSGPSSNYESTGHWSMMGMLLHKRQYHDEAKGVSPDRYLVVGRMSTNGYVIKEKIFRYAEHDEEMMLSRLHRAVQAVRGMRGWFSLKSVSGFGLYQVLPLPSFSNLSP